MSFWCLTLCKRVIPLLCLCFLAVSLPSPGTDVCRSPCPSRAGPCCGPDWGTSAERRRNTRRPPPGSATGCPPAPDSVLRDTNTHTQPLSLHHFRLWEKLISLSCVFFNHAATVGSLDFKRVTLRQEKLLKLSFKLWLSDFWFLAVCVLNTWMSAVGDKTGLNLVKYYKKRVIFSPLTQRQWEHCSQWGSSGCIMRSLF